MSINTVVRFDGFYAIIHPSLTPGQYSVGLYTNEGFKLFHRSWLNPLHAAQEARKALDEALILCFPFGG